MLLKNVALLVAALTLTFLLPLSAQNAPPPAQPVLDLSAMDETIDPCVDFYTYSCGGWMKNNPIPPDQSSWSAYGKLQDENFGRLRGILEAASASDAKRDSAHQKIGDYYASCTDEKAVEAAGIKPLNASFTGIERIGSKPDLATLLADGIYGLPLYRRGTLFHFRSDQDAKDSTQIIAETDQGGLGLPDRDYYLKDDEKSQQL